MFITFSYFKLVQIYCKTNLLQAYDMTTSLDCIFYPMRSQSMFVLSSHKILIRAWLSQYNSIGSIGLYPSSTIKCLTQMSSCVAKAMTLHYTWLGHHEWSGALHTPHHVIPKNKLNYIPKSKLLMIVLRHMVSWVLLPGYESIQNKRDLG